MESSVQLQNVRVNESLAADVAGVSPQRGVDPSVRGELRSAGECAAADAANERRLAAVHSSMRDQVCPPNDNLAAYVASVRLNVAVDQPPMRRQVGSAAKRPKADVTLVRPRRTVRPLMLLEGRQATERPVAVRTCVRPFIGVGSSVAVQFASEAERLLAHVALEGLAETSGSSPIFCRIRSLGSTAGHLSPTTRQAP